MIKTNPIKSLATRYIELVLAIIGFITLFWALAIFTPGGPVSTDILWYMNAGINGIKDPFILNRYFHVFLEAIFLKAASSPLVGVQRYWAFLTAGTCLLIYLTARYFSRRSHPLHGLLAVALFFSMSAIADTSGVALVDITAMFMVFLLVSVYLASARIEHRSMGLILLFGFLFFLAIKTKETTLAASVLLIGFGFTDENAFDWKVFLRRLAYWVIGVAVGVIFFIILNSIFLYDPLFGFRPGDIRNFLQTYVSQTENAQKPPNKDNWYTAYFLKDLWIPFTLFLISGAKAALDPDINPKFRLIWLVPLVEILFVTVTIGNQWGFSSRFIFPTLPVICLLGPQFLNLNLTAATDRRKRIAAILLFCAGLLLLVIVRLALRYVAPKMGWDIGVFLSVVFIPILLSIILALAFLWKEIPLALSGLISLLIIAIVTVPIADNIKDMVKIHPNQDKSKLMFYPFSAFSDQIQFNPKMHFYTSTVTWDVLGVGNFAKDKNEIASLFNIYFDSKSTKNNFQMSPGLSAIPLDLETTNYTYALLSLKDWQAVTDDPETKSLLEGKYLVTFDKKNWLVLLSARVP